MWRHGVCKISIRSTNKRQEIFFSVQKTLQNTSFLWRIRMMMIITRKIIVMRKRNTKTRRGRFVIAHLLRILEVRIRVPVRDQLFWQAFCGFPQPSRKLLKPYFKICHDKPPSLPILFIIFLPLYLYVSTELRAESVFIFLWLQLPLS
jgi:hypothetical protein